jgi:hypothetical protein
MDSSYFMIVIDHHFHSDPEFSSIRVMNLQTSVRAATVEQGTPIPFILYFTFYIKLTTFCS